MKGKAVLDKEGNVIAVSYDEPEEDEEAHPVKAGAMVREGQREVEIDLPENYRKMSTLEFVQRVKADIMARREAKT